MKPKNIFILHEAKDLDYLEALKKQLFVFVRNGQITIWDVSQIVAGANVQKEIAKRFRKADIVLPLVSANFLASKEVYTILEQAQQASKTIFPVILRSCMWNHDPLLKGLAASPKYNDMVKPVSSWSDLDEAFGKVVEALVSVLENKTKPKKETPIPTPKILASSSKKMLYIAYADDDLEKLTKLYEILEKNGLQVWCRAESLLPGQRRDLQMKKAMKKADYALLLLTKASVESKGDFQKEIKLAKEKSIQLPEGTSFILPVELEANVELPYALEGIQGVDLYTNWERGMRRLLRGMV